MEAGVTAAGAPAAARLDDGRVRPRLWGAGLGGTAGVLCVTLGVSQAASPFTVKLPGAWFFGVPTPGASATGGGDWAVAAVVLVYAGVAALVASWYELARAVRHGPGTPLRRLVPVLAAWAAPLVLAPPLFSRDVYSYAAQGQMLSAGIDPYRFGPGALGHGPFAALVDPQWLHATAPYGPLWERLSQVVVSLSGHRVLGSVVGFRVLALVGVALIAWGVPALARTAGADPAQAFVLGALNPVVLLDLLAGAHNDAFMLGLLVCACALARRGHVVVGFLLCGAAASVKLPALVGALFIGWWWAGAGTPRRARLVRAGLGVAGVAAVVALIGVVSGLGWQFLGGLANPGVVVSWLDPATALGLGLAHGARALGLGEHRAAFVRGARTVALVLAAAVTLWLLARPRRETPDVAGTAAPDVAAPDVARTPTPAAEAARGARTPAASAASVAALGWSLLAFAVLGPVVWPWYEAWGFVFLAASVPRGWARRAVMALSAVACFADLPPAQMLGAGDPAVAALCWVLLAGALGAYALWCWRRGAVRRHAPAPFSA